MTSTRQLRCPSCDGSMQVVDRRGVRIDICAECRGVFLDRGELDKLLDGAPEYPEPMSRDSVPARDDDWADERDREWEQRRGRRRRGGWLGDVFDFD